MKRLVIKLQTPEKSKPIELEVPGEKPVRELVDHLIKALNWPLEDDQGEPLYYWFESGGKLINESFSLSQSGIQYGSLLMLRSGLSKPMDVAFSGPLVSPGISIADPASEINNAAAQPAVDAGEKRSQPKSFPGRKVSGDEMN